MGSRTPSPDYLIESESEAEEENIWHISGVYSGGEWDSSEEEPIASNLGTHLESLVWQVKGLLKYSITWKTLNPNSWLNHANTVAPSTPVHILREIGLRLSHRSHRVPTLEPIKWPPLTFFGVAPFQKPLRTPDQLSRDCATLNEFATTQLSQTWIKATPIPEYLEQIPDSPASGCCYDWLTKSIRETTRTEPIDTTYFYTDFQKAASKLLTTSL
ncbi:LOW QUALITY PROTEIN: DDB1- and CUL4-associated factor 16 [Erethizon dorsatum]